MEHRGEQSRHMDQRGAHSATNSKQQWTRVHCEAVYFGNEAEVKKKRNSCTFSEMSTQFQQYCLPSFCQFLSFTICNLTCSIWLRRWRKQLKAYCFAMYCVFLDTCVYDRVSLHLVA